MNEKIEKVKNVVKDKTSKLGKWLKEHPVITAVGTTIVGSAVSGFIGYKTGWHVNGRTTGKAIEKGWGNAPRITHMHGGAYGNAPCEPGQICESTFGADCENELLMNAELGAGLMQLQSGHLGVVYKTPDNYCDLYLFDDTQTAEKDEILKAVGKVTGCENGLWW